MMKAYRLFVAFLDGVYDRDVKIKIILLSSLRVFLETERCFFRRHVLLQSCTVQIILEVALVTLDEW